MKHRRSLILGSLFMIPLLSLGRDVSSMSRDLYMTGAGNAGSASLAEGIIIALALIFSREVYKFYIDQKKWRQQGHMDMENGGL